MGTVRILLYAINGIGLGHLTRLLAVARSVRELSRAIGVVADLQFVTTSEGSDLVRDFPVYKIPSKTAVAGSDSDRRAYVAGAKILLSNVIAAVRPDILVLDTVPEGAFRELVFVRDFARRTVFIDRLRKHAAAIDRKHQTHLALFDRILVPDDPANASDYPLSPRSRERRRFVGRVHGYRSEDAWSRERVRAYFAIPSDRTLVYVSAGGGGDQAAREELESVIHALRADPGRHLLVGYGPLYRGPKVYGEGVTPVVEPEIWRFFPGIDVAVSAAGYNTYEELLAAGVPSIFYAQDKGLDAQGERVRQGAEAGWHRYVERLDAALLQREVERLEDTGVQLEIRAALRARGEQRGALRAATELLALHAGLEGSPIARRKLLWCAAARAAWRPCSEVAFAEAFEAMQGWFRTALDRGTWDEHLDRAAGAWSEGIGDRGWPEPDVLAAWMAWGTKLVGWQEALDWPQDRWKRLVQGAARDAFGAADRRADMVEELLEAIVQGNHALSDELAQLVDSTSLQNMAAALQALATELEPAMELDEPDEQDVIASAAAGVEPGCATSG